MARKKSPPKPAARGKSPATIPFTDEDRAASLDLLMEAAPVLRAARLLRLTLQRASVEADPVLIDLPGRHVVRMDEPEIEASYHDGRRVLRILCTFRLRAEVEMKTPAGLMGDDPPRALSIEACFQSDYELAKGADFTDDQFDAFASSAAITRAWPYWRDFVRDASTRTGAPVVDVPHDIVF